LYFCTRKLSLRNSEWPPGLERDREKREEKREERREEREERREKREEGGEASS
jgi:hypothetical protein